MKFVLWLVVFLVPLSIAPHVLFYFDVTPKVILLLLGVAVLLPWFCGRGAPGFRRLLEQRPGRWFCWLLAAQGISLALSTVLSADPAHSLIGGNWRRFGAVPQAGILLFALVVAAHIAANPESWRGLLAATSAAGTLAALYGILQYFGWDPWIERSAYHVGEGIWTIVRPPGTLGHADYFATYLLYAAFSGAALALSPSGKFGRALGIGSTSLAAAAIVLSGTRAAILGLLVGGVLMALWLRLRSTTPVSLRSKAATVGALAVVFAGAVVFYGSSYGQLLRSRIHWERDDPWGGARLLLWRDSLGMARRYWAAGAGPEMFATEFPRFESVRLAQVVPDAYYESPHNISIDALTAQGVPGLAILLALCALAFYAASRIRNAPVVPALAAGFAAGLVSSQFTSFIVTTALFFYLFLAVPVGLSVSQKDAHAPRRRPNRSLKLGAVAILAALPFAFVAIRLFGADYNVALAQRQLQRGNLRAAAASYSRARGWELPGMSADLWYSRSMAAAAKSSPPALAIAAWMQAMEAAIRAVQTVEDRSNAWYNAAEFYAAQNDWPHTEESLRSAIGAAPNWFKPHWILAQVCFAQGRLEEAGAEAKLAAQLDAGKDASVVRTWDQIRAALGRKRR